MRAEFAKANDLLCEVFARWVETHGEKSGAQNFYNTRLGRAAMIQPYEVAVAEFLLATMDAGDQSYEIGCGFGQLPLLVAVGGRRMTGLEYDRLRFAGAAHLLKSMRERDLEAATRLGFIKGRYPQEFDWRGLGRNSGNVLVFTNVVATPIKEQEREIVATFPRFDAVIVMISHFGWNRSPAEQADLERLILAQGFDLGREVFADSSARILEFRRKSANH